MLLKFMNHIFRLAIIIILFGLSPELSECEWPDDGKYTAEVLENDSLYIYELEIEQNSFTRTMNGESSKGYIETIGDCIFYFNENVSNNLNIKDSTLTSLLFRSFGSPVMEIKKVQNDTIYFRTTRSKNLHITINEGVLYPKHK